jgi:CubicO group peptidase (beta-lactamase class C family)
LALIDNRRWSPELLVNMTHNEQLNDNWPWEAGEEKDYDIVITFNRRVAAKEPQPDGGQARDSFVGAWHGFFSKGTQFENGRVSAAITRNDDGSYRAHFNFDEGHLAFYSNNSEPKVTVHQNTLKAVYDDGNFLELNLDADQKSITGEINAWKHPGPFTLVRGNDFLVPRLDEKGNPVTAYSYQAPEDLKDGLKVGVLQTTDPAFAAISASLNGLLHENIPNLHSLLVIHKGQLVVEDYFYGYGPQDPHPLFSVTKSVFSTLFGIAQDKGLMSVDEKLYDLYPEYRAKPDWDARKNDITVGMLLAMDSGFACDDFEMACSLGIYSSSDWVDYTLTLPLNNMPGNHWVYNGTSLIPLSNWIVRKSGLSLADFAQKYLNDPLGIRSYAWETGPNGVALVHSNYWLTPRDMAKIGLLYLNHGQWNGKQILSEKWVAQATSSQTAQEPRDFDYGYLWWLDKAAYGTKTVSIIEANGWGGQYIFMVPELDLVCVITAGNYKMGSLFGMEKDFFKKYILSAF